MGFEILLSLAKIQIIRYNLRGKRELLSIQSKMFFLDVLLKIRFKRNCRSLSSIVATIIIGRKNFEMTIFHSMILYEGGFL